MKLLSLFSGIGAFEKALQNINMNYDLVNYCEIDKFAARAYSIIHGVDPSLNLGDITKVDEKALPKDIDLLTYGFPCQDISVCGTMRGLTDSAGNKTRSGLFFDALRIIKETQPKIAIAENVKNLTSKGMKGVLDTVLTGLSDAGYTNCFRVLNAMNYGLPQNRERVFIVSVRNDIKKQVQFPPEVPLEHTMADYLEHDVDEKYFLSAEKTKYVIRHHEKHRQQICDLPGDVCRTLLARDNSDPKVIKIAADLNKYKYESDNRIYSTEGSVPTLRAHSSRPTMIEVASLNCNNFASKDRIFSPEGISPTLMTVSGGGNAVKIEDGVRYRYLTPREYWRLIGFDDIDVDKLLAAGISKSQLYKMAGNSIAVPVLEAIFKQLKFDGFLG